MALVVVVCGGEGYACALTTSMRVQSPGGRQREVCLAICLPVVQRTVATGGDGKQGIFGEVGTRLALKITSVMADHCGMSQAAGSHLVDLGSGLNR